ncbi:tRNA (uridine-2'-O-)-methyltransferase trm7 [Exophiala xenobiotica]|nr:tRNA (uridine-2'-O-)-methyltransferase trm7 [Exophiala xenobiotica]
MKVLRPGGKFVAKIFRGRNVDIIFAQLKLVFERVHIAKPRSSRASSIEAFVVCEGYRPVKDWTPELGDALKVPQASKPQASSSEKQTRRLRDDGIVELHFEDEENDPQRWIAPFLACGDLSAWDADATYKLPEGHTSLPPVQPPTAPPYKEAIERRRAEGGAYGKTKNRPESTEQSGT